MPTNTWELPPRQSDSEAPSSIRSDEQRNLETPQREHGRNHDASVEHEPTHAELEDINTDGSER